MGKTILENAEYSSYLNSTLPVSGVNTGDLAGYLVSYFPVDLEALFGSEYADKKGVARAGFAIYVPAGEDVEVSAILNGIANNLTNQTVNLNFTVYEGAYDDGAYDVYLVNAEDLAVYNMLETMTITIGEKTGTFNLAAYVAANPDVKLTNALYRFAEAAKAFKMVNAEPAE